MSSRHRLVSHSILKRAASPVPRARLPNWVLLAVVSIVLSITTGVSSAGEADVLSVDVDPKQDGTYTFHVTVRHADEGWNHYADGWEVLTDERTVIATRTLYHPHVDEQPFTRSLGGVTLPAGTTAVSIRAHDSEHGYGGKEFRVSLTQEVSR